MSAEQFSLAGRVALVTGASRGIGQALALGLAGAGADVALAARSEDDLRAVAAEAQSLGRRAEVFPVDVSRVESVRTLVAGALDRMGALDILVNVAGINRRKPSIELTEDDWDAVLDVNLKAVFFASQTVGRYWLASGRFAPEQGKGRGKIINIASLTSAIGIPRIAAYAASKSGVLGITRTLAVEWAPHGICVNALAPGYIETPLTRPLFDDPTWNAWIHSRIPMRQHGFPADLVGTAVFLASPASDYVTGQTIFVDGGWMAG